MSQTGRMVSPPTCRRWRWWHCVILIVLASYVVVVSVWIERLNQAAGTVLPRQNSSDGQAKKWRVAAPELFQQSLKRETQAGGNVVNIDVAIRQNLAEYRLREVVGSFGLAQYVMAGVVLFLGMRAALSPSQSLATRICGSCAVSSGAMAYVFAFVRQYWAGLGW